MSGVRIPFPTRRYGVWKIRRGVIVVAIDASGRPRWHGHLPPDEAAQSAFVQDLRDAELVLDASQQVPLIQAAIDAHVPVWLVPHSLVEDLCAAAGSRSPAACAAILARLPASQGTWILTLLSRIPQVWFGNR